MATEYYDRYEKFRIDGKITKIPFIKIDKSATDIYINFDVTKHRLDTLSYKYYGDPNYGWLLMLANPQCGSIEFEIPDGSVFRIPYPIGDALQRYERNIPRK